MTQASLWLPEFEFEDALFGALSKPISKAVDIAAQSHEEETEKNSCFDQVVQLDTSTPVNAFQDEEEPEVETVSATQRPATYTPKVATKKPAARETSPWPVLDDKLHANLNGAVTKFEANMKAIATLRQLEESKSLATDEQRKTLNQYTGWGGIKQPFDHYVSSDWLDRAKELKEALTEQEFSSAKESTLCAHFTPISIAKFMWSILGRLGFSGGKVVECSAGNGILIGSMPSETARLSNVTAVELDSLTARMLKVLYGHAADIHHASFESVNLPEGQFDLVVSNVPFGNYGVPDLRRKPYSNFKIHNYFVARSLDLVREGGLVVVITSSHFLDNESQTVREYIARKAKLLGAIRLPAGAFATTANTNVVADIVIFQKRIGADVLTSRERDLWIKTAPLLSAEGSVLHTGSPVRKEIVNNYWNERKEAVSGTWTHASTQYGQCLVPKLTAGSDLVTELESKLPLFDENIYIESTAEASEVLLDTRFANSNILPGSFTIVDGDIYRFDGYTSIQSGFTGKKADRIARMVRIRDILRTLISAQCKSDVTDSELSSLRYKLNVEYDQLVSNHGIITSTGNRYAMASDPSWPLLLSLEHYDEETDSAKKADIFFERTIFSKETPKTADNPEDALAICLAELGCIDSQYIGNLLGNDGDEALQSLTSMGAVFIEPLTAKYVDATEYLSGNVRVKLATAQAAGIAFDRNVKALEASLPKDLRPNDIDVIPGSTWIPVHLTEAFLRSLVEDEWKSVSYATIKVKLEAITGIWSVESTGPLGTAMNCRWGTSRINGFELFSKTMNMIDAEVRDKVEDSEVLNPYETAQARLKQDDLKEAYKRWIWSDDVRANELARVYNDTYNVWANRKYDGSRLRLPGYSHALTPREHQLNAIARIATGWNTLLAHVVGAGKTLTMICGSMELRRLGISKKPFHVVPNHMLEQYTSEFMRAYPNASVLMATKEDLKKEKRRAFAARCATGNWDAVVMTHSMWERISADKSIAENYIGEILSELRGVKEHGAIDRVAARSVNRSIKDWEARLKKLEATWKKDDLLTLSETGCDWLFFDESHLAKNLFRISNMKNVAGLNNANSQRSFDLLLKCMQLQKHHGNQQRGVVHATGTIVSNSLSELHVAQRYLQPFTLKAMGLDKFDAWAAQFGRTVNSLEISPDGSSFRMNKRFKLFVNMPELMGVFREVADIQTREMLNLPVPEKVTGSHQICVAEPSDEVKEYVVDLVKRAEKIRSRQVNPADDNMLAVTGDGQKVALDMRMVDRSAKVDSEGKIPKCADNVFRIWQKTAGFKGTQIIFSDMGTPTGKSFNVYAELRSLLIARGVPQHEIAFIHDAETQPQKSALFAKVRSGAVRVLIGSTSKCGMGTNVQTRLYAVHHLTTPWRPSDIEQRDGRIERQGNTCSAIEIWRYITSGTFDAFMWQTLTSKAGFVSQIMSGNADVRTVEDAMMATLSYDEVKALACGNPAVREKAMIDAEIMSLSLKSRQHSDSVWTAKRDLGNLPYKIKDQKAVAVAFGKFAQELNSTTELTLVVNGKVFKDTETVEKILTLSIAELRDAQIELKKPKLLGKLNGADTLYVREWEHFKIYVQSNDGLVKFNLGSYSMGSTLIRKLKEVAADAPGVAAEQEGKVRYLEEQESIYQRMANEVFAEEEKLSSLIARSKHISMEMGLLKDMAGTAGQTDGDEVVSSLATELVVDLNDETPENNENMEEAEELLELN